MITELKKILKKYSDLSGHTDYVSTHEVKEDIYQLIRDARLKRIPKDER